MSWFRNRDGIHGSPDQWIMQAKMGVAIGFAILFLIAVITALIENQTGRLADPVKGFSAAPKTSSVDDKERASAFAVVQQSINERIPQQDVTKVTWRGTSHEGHMGWFRFDGLIDVAFSDGDVSVLQYVVEIGRKPNGSWKIEKENVMRLETRQAPKEKKEESPKTGLLD